MGYILKNSKTIKMIPKKKKQLKGKYVKCQDRIMSIQ